MPTRLLLLRHGQSTWNAERRWQGQANPPLSEAGEQQACDASRLLGTFDAVITSTLERARHTAEIIAGQLGIGPVHLDERLIENDAGEWTGLNRHEIEAAWPGLLAAGQLPPGFETVESTSARAFAAMIEVARDHPDGEVLVLTHGGVIRHLRRILEVTDVHMPNLSGAWFMVDPHPPVDVRAGDVVHLLETPGTPPSPLEGQRV
jgi:broad specificity phosphatase PhoE